MVMYLNINTEWESDQNPLTQQDIDMYFNHSLWDIEKMYSSQ